MGMPNFEIHQKSLNSQISWESFELCIKELMWIMGDGNAFAE